MKILLIEDEVKLAGFIQLALEQAGYVTDHETDGAVGLQSAMVNNYDLILLDLKLPQMSGLEFLARLKKDPKLRSIPVVVMTASKSARDVRRALDLHANSYILKPLFWRDYVAAIKTIEDFWFGRAESSPK